MGAHGTEMHKIWSVHQDLRAGSTEKAKQYMADKGVGPSLRPKEAEVREKQYAAMRRRRMMSGKGLGSGLMPEELPSPSSASSKTLGVG
jgi:hypothetical protein|tara:strand:+ start:457 stop:723 length:267 start_codon:yes stop_codon:yes gene_type:complete